MTKTLSKFKQASEDARTQKRPPRVTLPNKNHPYADITIDVAFKRVFTNVDLLLGLLKELLPDLKISSIDKIITSGNKDPRKEAMKSSKLKYDPQEVISALNDRKAIMDIVCTTEDGDIITIEMQRSDRFKHFPDRSLFYASLGITNQVLKGNIKYAIKPLYSISFLKFRMLDSKDCVNQFSLHNDKTKEPYQHNRLHFTYIELPKFRKKEEECTTLLEKIIYTMKHSKKLKEMPKSFESDDYMKKMFNFALFAKFTEEQRILYIDQMYTANEYRAEMQQVALESRAAGLAEGLAEGRTEEKLTNARNFLAAGVPVETVASCTGLTESEVKALQQN